MNVSQCPRRGTAAVCRQAATIAHEVGRTMHERVRAASAAGAALAGAQAARFGFVVAAVAAFVTPVAAQAATDEQVRQATAAAHASAPIGGSIAGTAVPTLGIGSIVQTVVGLAFVIALVFGCAWLARRFGLQPSRKTGLVRVVGGVSLGQKERIAVVEIGQTWLVVGAAPGSVRTLHVMPAGAMGLTDALGGGHSSGSGGAGGGGAGGGGGSAGSGGAGSGSDDHDGTPGEPIGHEPHRQATLDLAGGASSTTRKTFGEAFRDELRRRIKPPRGTAMFVLIPFVALMIACVALPSTAFAQTAPGGLPALTATPGPGGGTTYSLSVQTMLLLTMLSFLPALVLMMTSFTRIIIVLSLLRQALGTSTTPPNQVLLGLALFLTFFVMSPVINRSYNDAYKPFSDNQITMQVAVDRGVAPFKTFMLRQTREADLALFARIAKAPAMQGPEDVPLSLLVPSFLTSELKTAFQIGFTVFIPFLIIDMVVASVLMSMGMMMVSPATISLPFKLMLFVLVDGWQLLIGSLAQSFVS
jgi:flagellar biosynthesis protein FliP